MDNSGTEKEPELKINNFGSITLVYFIGTFFNNGIGYLRLK